MLVDALREDFVEFDESANTRIKADMPDHYKGQKLTLFKQLQEVHPGHSILLPMESAVPTVTSVRIKSILNGGLSTFFETTDEFVSTEVQEDNILYQVKNRKGGDSNKVAFYGDHIWSPMYGQYFDELVEFSSENTRDLDTLDNGVRQAMLKKLHPGDQDFKLLVTHVIGVDSAGHTYNS
jgi:predicted AlkP superfamily pyrophosphatase or phosphodiesterase